MKILASRIDNSKTRGDYKNRIRYFSPEKRQRIAAFRNEEDALRTISGEILVRDYIIKNFSIPDEHIDFTLNPYGKPCLESINSFYFNISHSDSWVVAIMGNWEAGIDIELIKPIDLSIARNFFSENERKALESVPETKKLSLFYDIWTLKESFIKCIGKGLQIPLNSFSVVKTGDNIRFSSPVYKSTYYFRQYHIEDKYTVSACCTQNLLPEYMEIIHRRL